MLYTSNLQQPSSLQVPKRDIYSVSELNQSVSQLIAGSFPLLWVEGEMSNLSRAPSGHMYFSLKDKNSQVRCAMFVAKNRLLDFRPRNGQKLLLRARVSLYQARGDFQLIIEDMEPCGEGALRLAYERLKTNLHSEGLFDDRHKQTLPAMPQHIGLITSPTGAAIQDILHVLERRFPMAQVTVYPSRVQGKQAAEEICYALALAETHAQCDVLILARGGGSIEDLWSFNEETVARAIFDCSIPIISGIGHEIDTTIADFVADCRAPTPSAAAEMATPEQAHLNRNIEHYERRLHASIENTLTDKAQRLDALWQRLQRQHPEERLAHVGQRSYVLNQYLTKAVSAVLVRQRQRLATLILRLQHSSPAKHIQAKQEKMQTVTSHLWQAIQPPLEQSQHRLQLAAQCLHQISPLATLGRGYAVATNASGQVIKQVKQVKKGDTLHLRLEQGQVKCMATHIVGKRSV